jgi:hypothetical protein
MAIRKSSSSGIPFGNTAGRPANPGIGQLYSNGQVGRLELYTSTGWQNIVQETPGLAGITGTYNESAGSGTFTISGTNFVDGGLVYAVGTNAVEYQATTSTYNSIVQMTAVFSNLSAAYEPYDIKIVNPSNLFGLLPDAFFINDSPVWSTTAGSLGNYMGSSIQLATTDDESNTITYSVTSGSLPTGLSLSSSGLISGTATGNPGTYTFTVSASDGSNTAVTRSFSLIVPPTITGGTVTISDIYRIHTFTGSGSLVSNAASLSVDYLVVAGGGGGGARYGGGGGAGGMLTSSTSLASGSHSVTIGAGGAGATMVTPSYGDSANAGSSGQNSSLNAIIATGGGGGGSADNDTSGKNGGSGGGSFSGSIGLGTSGQGNNGGQGSGTGSYPYKCGGGGGAGGFGESANTSAGYAGAGGIGLQSSITGTSTYYAGGGGGGSHNPYSSRSISLGGLGGGGNSGAYGGKNGGANGSTNTGGGAGGSSTDSGGSAATVGGVGGSGIVIVRYLKSVVGL